MTTNLHAAVKRRSFSAAVRAATVAPREDLTSVGEGTGAWVVPERLLFEGMVCWYVGDGDDVSFAAEMVREYGARVRFFVSAPSARSAAEAIAAEHRSFALHEVAIAAVDASSSRSSTSGSGSLATSAVQRRRLDTLAREFVDGAIDLLCLDLGGDEYDVLQDHDLAALGVRVLCVNMHGSASAPRVRTTINRLRRQGFDVVHRTDPAGLTFARREASDRNHALTDHDDGR